MVRTTSLSCQMVTAFTEILLLTCLLRSLTTPWRWTNGMRWKLLFTLSSELSTTPSLFSPLIPPGESLSAWVQPLRMILIPMRRCSTLLERGHLTGAISADSASSSLDWRMRLLSSMTTIVPCLLPSPTSKCLRRIWLSTWPPTSEIDPKPRCKPCQAPMCTSM